MANLAHDPILERPTHVRYLVLVWMCLFAMLAYVHRSAISVPAKLIEHDLNLDAERLGLAMSMFLWGYAALQLPGGLLADRWGSRLILPIMLVISGVATGLMGLAEGLVFLIFCRFFMGLAQAGLFPGAVKTFSFWFPPAELAMPSGMLAGCMSAGAALASGLTGFLLGWLSWREIQVVFALPGLALAVWFWLWFRDRPAEHGAVNDAERAWIGAGTKPSVHESGRPATPWRRILTCPSMALICGQQFCRAAGYIFYLTWMPTYFQETQGVNVRASGFLSSLPLLAVVVGSPSGGLLMDWLFRRTGNKWLSRKGLAIFSLALASLLFLVLVLAANLFIAMAAIVVGAFFAGLCGPCAYTATIDFGGKHVATVFSLMNMAGNIGAAIFPLIVPPLAKAAAWEAVPFLLAGIYAAAVACWLFLDVDTRIESTDAS